MFYYPFTELNLTHCPVTHELEKQNQYLSLLLSSLGLYCPSEPLRWHSTVGQRWTPVEKLLVHRLPSLLLRMKKRGKPRQFLTLLRWGSDKEEERSAQLVFNLSLCPCSCGCHQWEAILPLRTLPRKDSLETRAFSLYHRRSFSIQSSGWIIYKGTRAFNGFLDRLCWHLIARAGENNIQQAYCLLVYGLT